MIIDPPRTKVFQNIYIYYNYRALYLADVHKAAIRSHLFQSFLQSRGAFCHTWMDNRVIGSSEQEDAVPVEVGSWVDVTVVGEGLGVT